MTKRFCDACEKEIEQDIIAWFPIGELNHKTYIRLKPDNGDWCQPCVTKAFNDAETKRVEARKADDEIPF